LIGARYRSDFRVCKHKFVKLIAYFRHFLVEEVNLSQARVDQLDDRVAAVEKALRAEAELGPLIESLIPQGSYAQRTIIDPTGNHEFDADVLLKLVEQTEWEAKDYVAHVYAAFARLSTYRDMVRRRTRCVVVDYANEFHIDVVPYIRRGDSGYITNRKDNVFELTNPEGFTEWLDKQDRVASGHLIEVIRLMKFLRDFKQTFSCPSVILTTLLGNVVNFVNTWGDPKYYGDMAMALKNIVADLDEYLQANALMPTIGDPSCPTETFNHRWDQDRYGNFRNKIHDYGGKIAAAFDELDRDRSVALWQEIFGPDFKKPSEKTQLSAAANVTDNEKFIDRDFGFPVVLSRYQLLIRGRVVPKDGFRHWQLPKQGNRVPKGRRIRFEIVTNDVPKPYDVYWKIKNYGAEAERANCMRGEIVPDAGFERRDEPTAYRGNHYVECYIVKDGNCVAVDRQRVLVE
jgi:Second Messenger Oligonucleotide or Dinucleotide Synthetase domain/Adenylyl/Guanylyl and SMODS C-terminal sensor domain